jgi:hypothetical protein
MASRRKRTLTLHEAAEYANERGMIGEYDELDDDIITSLRALYLRTRWRQSTSSRRKGHGIIRAFHQALKRRLPKSRGLITRAHVERAARAQQRAQDLYYKAIFENGSQQDYRDAAEAFEIAAEAFEAIGDMRHAILHRKNARSVRDAMELNWGSSRDMRRTRHKKRRRRYR